MANRTMQAKAMKLRRQLRKLPYRVADPPGSFTEHSGTPIPARLRSEGVSTPRSPNRELVAGYKHRAKSLQTTMEEANDKVMAKYGSYFINVPPGRKEAQERRTEMILEKTDPQIDKLLRNIKARFHIRRG